GSTEYSIAVLDTGIDPSHSAFDGRLLASYNAMDNNNTPPIDGEGHGTHVSGIATGNFNMDQTVIQTSRGILPEDGFLYLDISVPNMNKTVDITVGVDWAEEGMDFPGSYVGVLLYDALTLTQCTGCSSNNNNGYLETTFSVPGGDYIAAFANYGGATGQVYEGWVKMPLDTQLPSVVNDDGFPQYAGIAHNTNLVSVKVLDNEGVGNLVNIISGIDWVIANKDKYKIVVVNLSLGIDEVVSSLDSMMTSLVENGILPVVAAGNEGPNSGGIFSPGSSPDALTVGAVNRYNEIAFYSSVGSTSANKFSSKPDILAPGGSYALISNDYATSYTDGVGLILSADNNNIGFNVQENDLVGYQGTSMAAPHVAGLAALLIESYTNESSWNWNAYDVRRIKQAILAGTFEVANIGLAGGENYIGDPDPSPTIDRSSKDYYEGWGMISAKAAFDALSKSSYFGTKTVIMEHENPFGTKVSSSTLFAQAGKSYTFTAEAPEGVDVDLLVYKAGGSDDGDLEVLFSSIGSSMADATNDESITISTPTDTEMMLVVRMVDSNNPIDKIIISVLDPDFIPFVNILNPDNNSIINFVDVAVDYESTANLAEFYLDESSLGVQESGYILSSTPEGEHNLTLKETNDNTGNSFSSKIKFTVDLTNPQLTVHNSAISSIATIYSFKFDASDNLQLSRLELLVDGELYNSSYLISDVLNSGLDLNPYYFNFGQHDILLILYDEAGSSDSIEILSVQFDHDTFIAIQQNREFEYGDEFSVFWDAGVDGVTPLSYVIYIDDVEYVNAAWNGNPITIQFPVLDLGQHEVKIDLSSSSLTISSREYWEIIDTTMPLITGADSGLYDSTFDHEIKFEIIELLPKELNI
ncbi:MAG: S8 family serine peptidase, partial [Candidatus Heimdallarchaeota archaeon]|nr:S8 family serine peptidase [Candidatus Heimdallarchaeota archaeon]